MENTKSRTESLESRIAELLATPRALVGSDSGTHGKPDRHDIWMTIEGEEYSTYSFAGGNATRHPAKDAHDETPGRIREFREARKAMLAKRAELAHARRELSREAAQ
jgi:hypothetical protein